MPRPAYGERDLASDVVEVAFAPWESGYPVVPADDDQGVVQFPDFFEALKQNAQPRVEGHTFSEVVADILADFVYVRQESG